jgi:thiosulfate dehydrogenase
MKSSRIFKWLMAALLIAAGVFFYSLFFNKNKDIDRVISKQHSADSSAQDWRAPDISTLDSSAESDLIRYGRELVANTSYFLGPKGIVAQITNGMNCQNCHLQAGTKPWGNNYSAVNSTYPLYRDRSGSLETINKRISDCIERSLNGKAPDSTSREMMAIRKYIEWVGSDVPKQTKPKSSGITRLPYLDRAADTAKGRLVYMSKCQRCHGENGEGIRNNGAGSFYVYPPLWGDNSYNTAAGLYRLSRFAGYVKDNMPFDKNSDTVISVEEAWDVAAFVNSQPRPYKQFKQDWPDISKKPIDHPFGPYADGFSETQHKYGPFKPIEEKKRFVKEK